MRSKAVHMFLLAMRYITNRPFATTVSIIAIGFSLIFLVVVGNINFAIKKAAAEGSIKYPLIIAPEGSSGVQTVMSTIFHIDKPVGTIPFSVFEKIKKDTRVIAAYPLAVADNYMTYPIIGVNEKFIKDLDIDFINGSADFSDLENVVIGFSVAKRTGLEIGDIFHGSHGMVGGENAHEHQELSYKVHGILNPLSGPVDSAIYSSYQSVWYVHDEHKKHHNQKRKHKNEKTDRHKKHHHKEKLMLTSNRLTAILVQTKNPAFTGQLEREWSLNSGTQAVDTGRTIKKVVSYLNKAENIVEIFTVLTLGIVIIMILVTIVMSMNERKKELALMRSLGIGKFTISSIIMLESFLITLGGLIVGLIPGHILLWWTESWINNMLGITIEPFKLTMMEINGLIITLFAGQILALLTMIMTYRMNIVEEIARD